MLLKYRKGQEDVHFLSLVREKPFTHKVHTSAEMQREHSAGQATQVLF